MLSVILVAMTLLSPVSNYLHVYLISQKVPDANAPFLPHDSDKT